MIHHRQDVLIQQLVGIRRQIPRAPAMASTIDHDNPMARAQKGRNLMCSVAAVAKAAMQQDNGRTFIDVGVPDAGAAVLDVVRPLRRR